MCVCVCVDSVAVKTSVGPYVLSGCLHVCVCGASQWAVDNGAVDKPTVHNITVSNVLNGTSK